jgi:hypothetical protein
MKEERRIRDQLLKVRLTQAELSAILTSSSKSTCQCLSEYVRMVLLNKPVTVKYRNASLDDFMTEMKTLINELNAIGNNYNQVVKRLHGLTDLPEIKAWLIFNESARGLLLRKMDEIKLKIAQINDAWLQ